LGKELAVSYGKGEKFSLKIHHLSELLYFPTKKIPGAFNELKPHLPEEVSKISDWLNNCYVHHSLERHICVVMLLDYQHCVCQFCGLCISACGMDF
jgi:ferredoxin